MYVDRPIRAWLLVIVVCMSSVVHAQRPGWQKRGVDLRISGRDRIKAIHHPAEKSPLFLADHQAAKTAKGKATSPIGPSAQEASPSVTATVIDSPPIDGFVPWVVAIVTDERGEELELDAIPTTTIIGNYPSGVDPQTDYAIGILDTGASVSLISFADAVRAGMFVGVPDLVSDNTISISGATGSADIWVSQPLGLYINGLGAIGPSGLLNTSSMFGEVNVAIGVGQPSSVGLPTAIGTPMSVFYTAHFQNDRQITVTQDFEQFTGPDITFYELDDPAIPSYSQVVPLELRPLGAYTVQYVPYINFFDIFGDLFDLDFSTPQPPSTITGILSQSVLFVHSVDLADGGNVAYDKDRFLFDTGAQVTVIGSRIAARLALDPSNPEFEVEIQGVTGGSIMVPGFYIDSLQIPALGQWLRFTNIPVILLDISSAEGGSVDGIIGMNLFVDYNFVLHGGGLFLQDDPVLELEPISYDIIADIEPQGGDGVVNIDDLIVCINAWLATANPPSGNWNPQCDIAPQPTPDGIINFFDFALLAQYWLYGISF